MNINEITSKVQNARCNEFLTAMEVWETRYQSFKAIEDLYFKGLVTEADFMASFTALYGYRENAVTAALACFPLLSDAISARRAIVDYASELVSYAMTESFYHFNHYDKWQVSDGEHFAVVDYYDVDTVLEDWYDVDYPGVTDAIHDLKVSFLSGDDNNAREFLGLSAEPYLPVRFTDKTMDELIRSNVYGL